MFEPLSGLFEKRQENTVWHEEDVRHMVTRYLQERLKSSALHCQSASGGNVVVRVQGAALKQEVLLLRYDLGRLLENDAQFKLQDLRVMIG